jgi:hypothetical protein
MKYLKLFESYNESIVDTLWTYNIKKYSINPDGSVDVDGNVDLDGKTFTELPIKFNKVTGHFYCSNCNLTTLIGCPNYVGDWFNCSDNNLTNLDGCPNYVGNNFICVNNKLTSLEGCPKEIGGGFYFGRNPIIEIIKIFFTVDIYLDYQETYNFLRKDCKIVKHLLEEAIKDYNEYYETDIKLPEKIKGYTYI